MEETENSGLKILKYHIIDEIWKEKKGLKSLIIHDSNISEPLNFKVNLENVRGIAFVS